jgi:histidyl-tRNA synthetase
MALSTQPYKGTRDFYPDDMRIRKWMFTQLREVCEQFGYEEYDTPILEPIDLYTAKTSEEIVNEQTYTFEDRGGRRVVMRPEMTPSVSRLVAGKRQELGYPLRLYSIPNCFRYERPQRGRLREFWQLNADLFGVDGIEADIEVIQLADACMRAFGAKPEMFEIRINSRMAFEEMLEKYGFSPSLGPKILSLMDRMNKPEEFKKKLNTFEPAIQQRIGQFIESVQDRGAEFTETSAGKNMMVLLGQLQKMGIPVVVDPTIARGFEYYTDIVFEVFDTNPENNRSMFGGGRYDGLVGAFGVEPLPTVGFGMGDVTLLNFLSSNGLVPALAPATDAVVLLMGDSDEKAQAAIKELRTAGLNVAVDYTSRKLDKKLKAVDKAGIQFAVFIGPDELQSGQFNVKDMFSKAEDKVSLDRVLKFIKDFQQKK